MQENYKAKAYDILKNLNIEEGDLIEIKKGDLRIRGILLPSYSKDERIFVIKLDNGYNIGISIDNISEIKLITKNSSKAQESERKEVSRNGAKSEIKIISTGGTIVSKVEYETGAVRPALTTEEIVQFLPEINEIAKVDAEVLFSILSENMKPEYWVKIAESVKKAFDEGNTGVVIAHGTDTMAYTASALAFSLRSLQGPVVLVGSQRSSDRPSSDSAINLLSAVTTAKYAPFGEVVVNMHADSSDTYALVHRGVKVRKMHSSRRDAFQSVNDKPLAKVLWKERKLVMLDKSYMSKKGETTLDAKFDNRAFLLYYYPGLDRDFLEHILTNTKIRGLIIAGTGLGHTSSDYVELFRKATKDGIFIGMTTQCLFGRVNMNVYTTGRQLLDAGVTPLEDMLPEVALVKLMWVLAHEQDLEKIRSLMISNLVGEINPRHTLDLFPRWSYE
ncbi:glutamyl-tRNA(Gln) amidotransferase, subunit D [Sulfolobus islandicus Y.G.57.14]|uniref:Glutamyl-tRNA(Gln) amidotransferase subunit D n=6 Tax=Saccharolobus islandicus TaxID=43080 RepID=GATD_SACI1|nr:Glu-tRNA(Gln) amidotransferase subunit GatD [Sulfolobus islandicus]C3MYR5.1 RecName: Full=Glutamyl-tRNA(Gln) amidotransferase subunit D; Short=Glu-ADT subunit D [Sulfolobus islandicus M.14.25]C3NE01.1 RecName: Full=Glutamyl-tRNA(Gln) amidotransferase subunit D; Short=Glu-ADT subunit D [Sulfolobus islandicus Y.G.57.14]C3NHQ2.1 RecName: Full=Glutamyl-tRNA(Gln) amidotransferase subunit D; Short=Glu-ADT subunit D [Sulfolobus islandicus Y.N.15.51]C4KH13.1 RecName: Full=Glutamyl-tRNA(Gln) amidotra